MTSLFGEPGQRMAYRRFANPNGAPPIVLLHGFTSSSAIFAPDIALLRQRFTVVTVELFGHGASDTPDEASLYTPEETSARLLELLNSLGYDRVLLCGHALGGALALRVAIDYPERVAGVVVANSNTIVADRFWRERMQPRMEELASRVSTEGTGFLRESRLFPGRSKTLPPALRRALISDFDRMSPEGVGATAAGLVVAVNTPERLAQVRSPVLIVSGEHPPEVMQSAQRLAGALRHVGARVVVLEDGGFAAHAEQPEEFSRLVRRFAESIGYLKKPGFAERHRATLVIAAGAAITAALSLGGAAVIVQNRDDGRVDDQQGVVTVTPTPRVSVTATPRPPGPGASPGP